MLGVGEWNEGKIARVLARQTFASSLCALPNCLWTGDEIDLLVIGKCLRIVDVEIKISRADLRADAKKAKWWHQARNWTRPREEPKPRAWPTRVWKHYYAMPASIWKPELLGIIQPVSGVLLLDEISTGLRTRPTAITVKCVRKAKPDTTAPRLTEWQCIQLARLASLRMWDAYKLLEMK